MMTCFAFRFNRSKQSLQDSKDSRLELVPEVVEGVKPRRRRESQSVGVSGRSERVGWWEGAII
jgi:hypothetical protein